MWSTPSTSSTRWSSIASLRCLTGARNRRRWDSGERVSNSATSAARSVRSRGTTKASVPSRSVTCSIISPPVPGPEPSQREGPGRTNAAPTRWVGAASGSVRPSSTRGPSPRSGLLRLPEDLRDLVDLGEQLVGLAGVELTLGAGGTGQLGGLVDQGVQLRVLLEVRGLEVVGPQHPEVVLDQL